MLLRFRGIEDSPCQRYHAAFYDVAAEKSPFCAIVMRRIETAILRRKDVAAAYRSTRVEGYSYVKADRGLKRERKPGRMNLQLFAIKSSDFKTIQLPKKEYAMVMHELNTHLSEEERQRKVVTKAIGDFVYTFENNGFDNYRIFKKKPIWEAQRGDENENSRRNGQFAV